MHKCSTTMTADNTLFATCFKNCFSTLEHVRYVTLSSLIRDSFVYVFEGNTEEVMASLNYYATRAVLSLDN